MINHQGLPLISGDFYLEHFHSMCKQQRGTYLKDVYGRFAQNFSWSLPIEEAAKDYDTYQAVLISDKQNVVLWVDKGFTDMTGYQAHEIVGNRPNMLHGPGTKDSERAQFHKGLSTKQSFEAAITNHRKSGEPYLCQVKIVPLFNSNSELTHYIAFEREVA